MTRFFRCLVPASAMVVLAACTSAPVTEAAQQAKVAEVQRAPIAGVPQRAVDKPAITLVLFSDYACRHCRQLHGVLARAIAANPDLRIVYRDWPILGAQSRKAARYAIASAFQGRHAEFDTALMNREGPLDDAALRAAVARAGLDPERLDRDLAQHRTRIDAILADNDRLAPSLGLQGTPGMVVGDYLIPGGVDEETMRAILEVVRKRQTPSPA